MGWQVLISRPGDGPDGDRVAIRHQLRQSGALALGNGTWVFSDDESGCRRAAEVDAFVQERQGHLVRFLVPDGDPLHPELATMVHAALDREWERLEVALDEAGDLVAGPGSVLDQVQALEAVRLRYVGMLDRDDREEASREAALRLDLLVAQLDARARDCAAWERDLLPEVRVRTSGLSQVGGPVRIELDPYPGPGWELGFVDFERRTYLPAPARPPLRHGVFTPPARLGHLALEDDLDPVLDGIERRIALYHASRSERDRGPALRVIAPGR